MSHCHTLQKNIFLRTWEIDLDDHEIWKPVLVHTQGRSSHSFFLKTVSPNTPLRKTQCSFFMRWVLKTRSMSQALTHFHWHAKESSLRCIPSRQILPSEIIVVMQLFLPDKPTFVNSLDIVGSALWLQGWVKIQIMSTGAGVPMEQTLLFPENILLLSLPLDVSSYTSLLTMVRFFKIWITEITS